MPKTVTIVLDEQAYIVPRLNIGQLEELSEATKRRPFDILRIALRRSTPPVEDISTIEASSAELKAAVDAIVEISGVALAKPGELPGSAPTPTA